MFSYEMIGIADQNGRTYTSIYGTYDRENGFQLNNYAYDNDIEDLLYELLHENCWSLKIEKKIEKPKPKQMTKKQIEAALGYSIEIKDDEKDTVKVILNEKRKDVDDIFHFLFDAFK